MWINQFEAEPCGPQGMYFYEPLKTKAPRSGVRPYCCLINRVVFYAYPYYTLRPGDTKLVDYGYCETEWNLLGECFMDGESWSCLAPLVLHEGQIYELCQGRVMRHSSRWMTRWFARRVHVDDWRYPFMNNKKTELLNGK